MCMILDLSIYLFVGFPLAMPAANSILSVVISAAWGVARPFATPTVTLCHAYVTAASSVPSVSVSVPWWIYLFSWCLFLFIAMVFSQPAGFDPIPRLRLRYDIV